MLKENNQDYYNALTGVAYEATLAFLEKIKASSKLSECDRKAVDKAIKIFKDLPEHWPANLLFDLHAIHSEEGGSVGFQIQIDSDQLVIDLSMVEKWDAGSEHFNIFRFYYERGCPAEDFEGDLTSFDAFSEEINSEYFDEIKIDSEQRNLR